MSEGASDDEAGLTAVYVFLLARFVHISDKIYLTSERKEYGIFKELLRMVSGLEARLMTSSEDEVMLIGELVMRSQF